MRHWKLLKNFLFLEYTAENKFKISLSSAESAQHGNREGNLEFKAVLISRVVIAFCLQNVIPYFASSIS
jgi:hypothetical protein